MSKNKYEIKVHFCCWINFIISFYLLSFNNFIIWVLNSDSLCFSIDNKQVNKEKKFKDNKREREREKKNRK